MQIVHGYAIGCGAGIPARRAIGHIVDCVATSPAGRRKKKVRRTSSTTPKKGPFPLVRADRFRKLSRGGDAARLPTIS